MTEYNWPKIRETLATHDEVMGWVKSDDMNEQADYMDPVSGHQSPAIIPWNWKPDQDLNQTKGIVENLSDDAELWWHELGWTSIVWYGSGRGERVDHENPAKAICLAVLKAIGEDLSDYKKEEE